MNRRRRIIKNAMEFMNVHFVVPGAHYRKSIKMTMTNKKKFGEQTNDTKKRKLHCLVIACTLSLIELFSFVILCVFFPLHFVLHVIELLM